MGKLFKVALGLFMIGIGLLVAFSVLSENNVFASVNEEDFVYEELIYDADTFTGFDFEFDNRDFIVRVSTDDKIKVVYYSTEKDPVIVTDNTATLKLFNEVKWYNQIFSGLNFFVNDDYYDLYLYLPVSVVYDLDLLTSNGKIDIMGISNLDALSLDTSNGRVSLDTIEATFANLDTSNGAIQLDHVTLTGNLDMNTSNGTITLDNVIASQIEGETSNGNITVQTTDCNSLELTTSNGWFDVEYLTCESVDLRTSNGGISVGQLISQSVYLDTSNGSITIEVIGDKDDYEVSMSTSYGDMDYDGIGVTEEHLNVGAPYEIELYTSFGDITIDFITQ